MSDIHVSNEGVIKMMKGLNQRLWELMNFILVLAIELGPVFAHLFQQQPLDKGEFHKRWSLAHICPFYEKGDSFTK